MEANGICPVCRRLPSEYFCICEGLPAYCKECRPKHETERGFHFSLPLVASEIVNRNNDLKHRIRLLKITSTQRKLQENLSEFRKCKSDLEVLFREVHQELDILKDKFLRNLESLEKNVSEQVEIALRETTDNAYKENYQPGTHLASLIQKHAFEETSRPIPAFTYQIQLDKEAFERSLGVTLFTLVPELESLNYRCVSGNPDEGKLLRSQLENVRGQLASSQKDLEKLRNSRTDKITSLTFELRDMKGSLECWKRIVYCLGALLFSLLIYIQIW